MKYCEKYLKSFLLLLMSSTFFLTSCGSPTIQGGIVDNGNKPQPNTERQEEQGDSPKPTVDNAILPTTNIFESQFTAYLNPSLKLVSSSDLLEVYEDKDQTSPLIISFSLSDFPACQVARSFTNYYGALIRDCGAKRYSVVIEGKPILTIIHNSDLDSDTRLDEILKTVR